MAEGERPRADRSIDVGALRGRNQPGQCRIARPHPGVQHFAAGDEDDGKALLRVFQAPIRDDARAVRRADWLDRLGDENDLVAVGGGDVAICLDEHIDWAGDIKRLHALDDEDGDGPGRHRCFSRIALAETQVMLAGIRCPHLLQQGPRIAINGRTG